MKIKLLQEQLEELEKQYPMLEQRIQNLIGSTKDNIEMFKEENCGMIPDTSFMYDLNTTTLLKKKAESYLSDYEIVESNSDVITYGTRFNTIFNGNSSEELIFVETIDFLPEHLKYMAVTKESPVGNALFGKSLNDEIKIHVNGREMSIVITEILKDTVLEENKVKTLI